jgi:hypothetical protein
MTQYSTSRVQITRTNAQLEDQCRTPYEKANNLKIRSSRVLQAGGVRCSEPSTVILYFSGAEFTQADQVGVNAAFEALGLPFTYTLNLKTHWSFNH